MTPAPNTELVLKALKAAQNYQIYQRRPTRREFNKAFPRRRK